jgi:hypothetical protein
MMKGRGLRGAQTRVAMGERGVRGELGGGGESGVRGESVELGTGEVRELG